MDLITMYYYTSVPIITCNMLLYSITSLSNSISSSQNVVKFISEHKDCDSVIFKNEIVEMDLENKLRIVETLIYSVIKRFSVDNNEFEFAKKEIQNPKIFSNNMTENNEFALVEVESSPLFLKRIDEPVKISLISTSEIVQNINALILKINEKINNYKKSYMKNIISLSLKYELSSLHKYVKILDLRLHMLFELLKIYLPLHITSIS
jgi:hypothetical protein